MFRKKLDESRVQIGVRVRESVKERLKSIASDKGTYPACVAERYIEDGVERDERKAEKDKR